MLPVCETPAEAVAMIRGASIQNLRSPTWLEYELLPALGVHENGTYPSALQPVAGKGLRVWQWPNQLSRYLAFIGSLGIGSYAELGLAHGGMFILTVEYLTRISGEIAALGVDLELDPTLVAYAAEHPNVRLIQGATGSVEVRRTFAERIWDLILIDADHTEEGCWADYAMTRHYGRNIAFHDIANDAFEGVGRVWRRLMDTLPRSLMFEFADQYPEVIRRFDRSDYGLGVVCSNPAGPFE